MEDSNQLDARRSALDDDLEEMEEDEEEGEFKVSCGIFTVADHRKTSFSYLHVQFPPTSRDYTVCAELSLQGGLSGRYSGTTRCHSARDLSELHWFPVQSRIIFKLAFSRAK